MLLASLMLKYVLHGRCASSAATARATSGCEGTRLTWWVNSVDETPEKAEARSKEDCALASGFHSE